MMKCEEAKSLLTKYLLGDLEESQASEVREHIERCADCSAEALEIQPTLDLLREALADTAPVPAKLEAGKHVRIYAAQPRKRGKVVRWVFERNPRLARMAAAFLVVAFLWIFSGEILWRGGARNMYADFGAELPPATRNPLMGPLRALAPVFKMGEVVSGPAASEMLEYVVTEIDAELPGEVQAIAYGGNVATTVAPALDRPYTAPKPEYVPEMERELKREIAIKDEKLGDRDMENKILKDHIRKLEVEIRRISEPGGGVDTAIVIDSKERLEREMRIGYEPSDEERRRFGIKAEEAPGLSAGFGGNTLSATGLGVADKEDWKEMFSSFGPALPAGNAVSYEAGEDTQSGPVDPFGDVASAKPSAVHRSRVGGKAGAAEKEQFAFQGIAKAGQDSAGAPPMDAVYEWAAPAATPGSREFEPPPVRYDALSAPERPLASKGFSTSRMPAARGSAPASESVASKVQAPARPAVEAVDAFEPALESPAKEVVTRENMPVPVLGRLLRSEDSDGDGLQPNRILDKNSGKREKKPVTKSKRDVTKDKLKSIVIPELDFRQANINDTIAFLQEQSVAFDSDSDSASRDADGRVDMVLALPASGASQPVEGADPFAAAGPAADAPLITFSARYISLQEALDIVTQVSNLKYNIDDNGRVRILERDAPSSDIIHRIYDLPESQLKQLPQYFSVTNIAPGYDQNSLKGWMDELGVGWPSGASIQYMPKVGKLFVANTPDNLEKLATVVAGLAVAIEQKEKEEGTTRFKAYGVNPVMNVSENAFSTFSIDVDTASYTLARNYIEGGYLPPAEAVRTEEVVNYFEYDYKAPLQRTFDVYAEVAPSKFGHGQHLLKIGVKGRRLGREEQRRAALTFLIDSSGSMETEDRIGLVKKSLKMLVDKLNDDDIVNIIQYDTRARLVLSGVKAKDRQKIKEAVDGLQCSGSTNLEDGIGKAYEAAANNFVSKGENRVLLLSDGVANLGAMDAEAILAKVEKYRKQGIYCSVFGVGMGTYDDQMLETLANKGDGMYRYLDSEEEAKRLFVDDLSATLNTIARDVKIQVEFNKQFVKTYRQLGYENRQLKKEQFRDDTVDAGEVGSGQSVTALYEIGMNPAGYKNAEKRLMAEPVATVRVRYRRVDNDAVEEIEIPVTFRDFVNDFDKADVRFRLAACAAEFAEILRGSPYAEGSSMEQVSKVLAPIKLELDLDQRVQEFYRLTTSAPGMARGE